MIDNVPPVHSRILCNEISNGHIIIYYHIIRDEHWTLSESNMQCG